jgi:hypothetical protein
VLKNERRKDQKWSKKKIYSIAKQLSIHPRQVYKWNWDQDKKLRDRPVPIIGESVTFKTVKEEKDLKIQIFKVIRPEST